MKHKNLLKWVVAGSVIMSVSLTESYSQGPRTRHLPDGTVIYSDGTIKRSDGTIKYPDGRVKQTDGSIKYPDGTVRYPANKNENKKWLPPGQLKKKYGTKSARPFAPGQRKQKFILNNNKENEKNKNK